VTSYPVELLLLAGLAAWSAWRPDAGAEPPAARVGDRPARLVAAIVGFALLANLAVLPLYGYQSYSYRHYLSFGLPVLWLGCGRAASLLGAGAIAGVQRIADHLAAHRATYLAIAVVGVLAANLGGADPDASWLFGRISRLIGAHWLALLIAVGLIVLRRPLFRPPWFPRFAIAVFVVVYICYRPSSAMKRANLVWFAADDRVWDSLRQRRGVVSSFALQGEVAWHTGRKNIPAPEWPMHIYSLAYDHKLAIEDVYLESSEALISTLDGPFSIAAPGFEGYARLQRWRTLPGYEVAFHGETERGYPLFRIKPHFKASTDFRLADPAAIAAMRRSPDRLELSDPRQVIYTAHGWGDYYQLDGKPVVAATDITRVRYRGLTEAPHEDASVTFFLDDRRPTSVDVEFYAPGPMRYQWYWNLDLYAYDREVDRPRHAIGSTVADAVGWHKVHLEIPAAVTRAGLNKLGFRIMAMQPGVLCPEAMSDDSCRTEYARRAIPDPALPRAVPPVVLRPAGIADPEVANYAMFAHSIEFHYEPVAGAAR
jgi:hypothetical protein